MLEAAAVPAVLKAIDWIFGEGSKVLEERRERRNAQLESSEQPARDEAELLTGSVPSDAVVSRDDALAQRFSLAAWNDSEKHVEHLLSLLEIHSRNYRLAKEKYAQWGSALVPPIVVNELASAESAIAETTIDIQSVLSKVYGKKITTPEIEAL
ncbi:hypothetical protein [Tateyamaria sp. SN3-11]|uniref:hypothetical protein n=1 Tax=Tateyamaria sp. SN3-11 TaxID=3092147 RepID=UPI0039EB30C4